MSPVPQHQMPQRLHRAERLENLSLALRLGAYLLLSLCLALFQLLLLVIFLPTFLMVAPSPFLCLFLFLTVFVFLYHFLYRILFRSLVLVLGPVAGELPPPTLTQCLRPLRHRAVLWIKSRRKQSRS